MIAMTRRAMAMELSCRIRATASLARSYETVRVARRQLINLNRLRSDASAGLCSLPRPGSRK